MNLGENDHSYLYRKLKQRDCVFSNYFYFRETCATNQNKVGHNAWSDLYSAIVCVSTAYPENSSLHNYSYPFL